MDTDKRQVFKVDYFLTIKPFTKNVECGDTGIIKEFDHKVFIGIIDVVGHGKEAYKIAVTSKDFLEKNYRKDLVNSMKDLHKCLKDTRGAVAGLCLIDLIAGELKYVGIGNITARIFGSTTVRIVSRTGIIGYIMSTPREEIMKLCTDDVLLLYTDGIKEHFELEDYPELLKDGARTIASTIIHKFGKKNDDAACIALRFTQMKNTDNHR